MWKRLIFWDFPRASWQYDIIVGLILAFIFFTPREVFKDTPRPINVVLLYSSGSEKVYWLDANSISSQPAERQPGAAADMIHQKTGKRPSVDRLEAVTDSEDELIGFKAYTKP